jgi:hypothetical protein
MQTGEGVAGEKTEKDEARHDRISVGGGDDSVTRIQLAARWAETFAPPDDSLPKTLKRFRTAFEYLDAVIHGVEPPSPDSAS